MCMTQEQNTLLATDEAIDQWWEAQSDWEKCCLVVKVMDDRGSRDGQEYVYAVEKPWKWKREAFEFAHRPENRGAGLKYGKRVG
jgi:hypothetical protein